MSTENTKLAGRPALYDSEEELKTNIEAYFEEKGTAATITGMAFYLGFESRQSIYDYADNGKFSYIIKRAKLFIESCYETKLSGNNPTGPIFFLKNMGWKDSQDHNFKGDLSIGAISINIIKPSSGPDLELK